MNKRKDKTDETIWLFKEEVKLLRNALEENNKERVLDIIFSAYCRSDFL